MAEGQEEGFLWDHTGENLEDDPLIDTHRAGYSTFYSPSKGGKDQVKRQSLSKEEVERVLVHLEEAHSALSKYVDINQCRESLASSSAAPRLHGRCRSCLKRFLHVLDRLTKCIIVVSLILQILNVVVLTIIDIIPKSDEREILIVGATIMIILQVANLFLVIYASIKLGRQLMLHSVSGIQLIQGYIATLLLFAGLYTATHRLYGDGWKFITEDANSPVLLAESYCRFLFFSVSTGTLCGSSNVLPRAWYNLLLASLQMLLSYTYFASILGQAIMTNTVGFVPLIRSGNSNLMRSRSRRNSTQSERSMLNHSLVQSST